MLFIFALIVGFVIGLMLGASVYPDKAKKYGFFQYSNTIYLCTKIETKDKTEEEIKQLIKDKI